MWSRELPSVGVGPRDWEFRSGVRAAFCLSLHREMTNCDDWYGRRRAPLIGFGTDPGRAGKIKAGDGLRSGNGGGVRSHSLKSARRVEDTRSPTSL